ncbi:MAG TPA: alpha/beta hydrolase [Acidimicrobiales bacterium]|nr:alpha/beta hydrolase [Acidimicrobiales bacterium]
MPVDPSIQVLLDSLAASDAPELSDQSVEEARAMMALLTLVDGEPEPVDDVTTRTLPGPAGDIPVRVYRNHGDGPLPVLVWYHGGGWVIGDLESGDPTARKLANRTGAVVVSVDYRLAPEHPYPAAVDDCWAALEWVAAHAGEIGGDPARLAVGGDSAGGNLSAVVALLAAQAGGPALRHQLLVYPVVDLTLSHPSIESNGEGHLLTKKAMEWFVDHYLGDTDPKDPRISPLYADDLSGVAPATIYTAEFDPLRDEGAAYAERLADARVECEHRCFDGMIHGFFGMGTITPVALEAVDAASARLRSSFS